MNPMTTKRTTTLRRLAKISACAALGALTLAAGVPAQAQNVVGTRTNLLPTKNTREINVAGSWFLNGNEPYALSGLYGIFTSPTLEVGATGSIAGAKHTSTFTSLGAFADYYFRGENSIEESQRLLPYVGVFAGYSHQHESNASLGAQAGVKYFLNPNVAATAEYQYRSTRHSNGTSEIVLGLSTFFR